MHQFHPAKIRILKYCTKDVRMKLNVSYKFYKTFIETMSPIRILAVRIKIQAATGKYDELLGTRL